MALHYIKYFPRKTSTNIFRKQRLLVHRMWLRGRSIGETDETGRAVWLWDLRRWNLAYPIERTCLVMEQEQVPRVKLLTQVVMGSVRREVFKWQHLFRNKIGIEIRLGIRCSGKQDRKRSTNDKIAWVRSIIPYLWGTWICKISKALNLVEKRVK